MPALEALAAEIGPFACAAPADVVEAAALAAAADRIEAALGPIAVWINGAGNGVYGTLLQASPAEFRRVTDVTYLGTVNGTREALTRMLPRGAGRVVNLCSAIAFHGLPLLSSYSGAKFAVRGFTQSVRSELAGAGTRVSIVAVFPPALNTPFFSHAASHLRGAPRPARPVYPPEVAAWGLYLASVRGGREVRLGGTTLVFGWATRLVPRLVDWAVDRLGEGQITSRPEAAARCCPSLFAPSPSPGAIHGAFGGEARRGSAQVWASRHRGPLGLLLLAAALLAAPRRRHGGGPVAPGS